MWQAYNKQHNHLCLSLALDQDEYTLYRQILLCGWQTLEHHFLQGYRTCTLHSNVAFTRTWLPVGKVNETPTSYA